MSNGTRVSTGGLITLKLEEEFRTNPDVGRLAQAAAVGDTGAVEKLIGAGVNVNATGDHYRVTPLMWAVLADNTRGIRALLKTGADPNQRVTNISQEEIRAIIGQPPERLTRSWEDARGDLMAFSNESAITFAIMKKNIDHLRLLLDAGGDPNIDGRVDPAMFDCTQQDGQINPMLMLMIERGGNPNLRDRYGVGSLLERFMARMNFATGIYLMEHGADPTYTHRTRLPYTETGQIPPPPPDDLSGYDRNLAASFVQRVTGADGDQGSREARKVRQMMIDRGVKFPVFVLYCVLPKEPRLSRFELLLRCHMPPEYFEKIFAWNRREGRLDGPYDDPDVVEIQRDYLAYIAKHPQ